MALPEPGSVLMSKASITTECRVDDRVLSDTWVYVGVQGPHCHWGHDNLDGLCCHKFPRWYLGPGSWVHGPAATMVWVEVHVPVATGGRWNAQGLDSHLRPWWCPRVLLLPGPKWSGWTVLPPGAMETSGPKLLQKTWLGPCSCYRSMLPQRVGTMHVEI